jgi:hypothetical protein
VIHQLEFEMKLTSLSNHSVWHASCRIKSTHNRFLLAVASIGLLGNGLTPGARAGAWNKKIQRRSPSDLVPPKSATRQARQTIKPYQQLRYWSGVPFRLGAIDVVKYSATRLQTMRRVLCKEVTPNALQDELTRYLEEDSKMSALDFGQQFLGS